MQKLLHYYWYSDTTELSRRTGVCPAAAAATATTATATTARVVGGEGGEGGGEGRGRLVLL